MMRGLLIVGASALVMSGCATAGPTQAPVEAAVAAPESWRSETQAGSAVEAGWWSAFGDAALTAAVDEALARNTDIAVAESRVREAEAFVAQSRSALSPSLTGSVAAQEARELNAFGQAAEAALAQPQLQVAYEIDLWGRLRSADAAARASLQASRFSRDAAALSVAGATARAYVALVALDAQLEVASRTLVSREDAVTLARRRAEAGQTSRLERTQAEAEFQAAAQRIPALELAIRRQENALRLLTGALPGPIARGRFDALIVPEPKPGLPSSLLARRPDIAQAESQLVAADASFASSRAALLPQVRLSASLAELFVEGLDPVTIWSAGGSVLAPLFDGGRLTAQADASEARRDQAALAYRRVVLGAFSEVENAMEGVDRLQAQADRAEAQRLALNEAVFHARNRYRAGYTSYLEELDAQRGLLTVETALIQLREMQMTNAVALYQALGGGWTNPAPRNVP
ncbi:NodT family efflux transporter outer membrane factor (OMF) lipoprotein [Sphingomonas jejuensis]|uniref:NodT family efflux transporter outer membrane factor (OMF) lipoprotein n=1 Tax=Sphingomonas jejuensis TaxID=904715 RepID=A0ABX0XS89_9SPHN|nr:efflux transporter outer membrane subunit [Sphingomonas jejuensis]NJC35495.1 NodT family efflux transporter outer membrane factor (OMF) lipoprotein [Sphingomonas jejuensis]